MLMNSNGLRICTAQKDFAERLCVSHTREGEESSKITIFAFYNLCTALKSCAESALLIQRDTVNVLKIEVEETYKL